jgi:hypothetical protein
MTPDNVSQNGDYDWPKARVDQLALKVHWAVKVEVNGCYTQFQFKGAYEPLQPLHRAWAKWEAG